MVRVKAGHDKGILFSRCVCEVSQMTTFCCFSRVCSRCDAVRIPEMADLICLLPGHFLHEVIDIDAIRK